LEKINSTRDNVPMIETEILINFNLKKN